MKIINLTRHRATPEQVAAGVIDLKVDFEKLVDLLTFISIPSRREMPDYWHYLDFPDQVKGDINGYYEAFTGSYKPTIANVKVFAREIVMDYVDDYPEAMDDLPPRSRAALRRLMDG